MMAVEQVVIGQSLALHQVRNGSMRMQCTCICTLSTVFLHKLCNTYMYSLLYVNFILMPTVTLGMLISRMKFEINMYM